MASQQLSRASPAEGFSIARQVMEDVADYYLANGGPATAREHVEKVANELKIYPDCHEAYLDTMARIAEAEMAERLKAEELLQQQQQSLIKSMMGVVKPHHKTRKPTDDKTPRQPPGKVALPPKLSTPEAMIIWKKLQQAGLIDEYYQPVGLSLAKSAVLANEIIIRLSTEMERMVGVSEKWILFEALWNRSNMRADYYHATLQKNISKFTEKLKRVLDD